MRKPTTPETPAPLVYSITVGAKHANVSRSELYNILKRGELRAKKLGRRTVILHDDLHAYLRGLPDYISAAA